jgi:hypothetical protein
MGIMSSTVSIYQYLVKGDLPGNLERFVTECLHRHAFSSIGTTPDEESIGWVTLDNHLDARFEDEHSFARGDYLAFTLRRDRRKVPGTLLKNLMNQECERWMKEHPSLQRVPSNRRMEIRENLYRSLLSRMLPVPATCDLAWNVNRGIVTVASVNAKELDLVEDEFRRTFQGLSLLPLHPLQRAEMVLDASLQRALVRVDQASSKDVLLQIKKNRWLGWEFFLWAMYQTSTSPCEYTVAAAGPFKEGERFVAYMHDGFVLTHEHEAGLRKSRIIGPQQDFAEARTAIQSGKNIVEGVLYFEKDDMGWRMNLKGEIFAFGSYKCPPVKLERDDKLDPEQERLAVFYERMCLLEEGLQLFNSLLIALFSVRLGSAWDEKAKSMHTWLHEERPE